MEMQDRCQKKKTLLQAWQTATQAYWDAVRELANNLGSASVDDCKRLERDVEKTRTVTANTRNAFALHVDEHGC
jgi:hypothetical protein